MPIVSPRSLPTASRIIARVEKIPFALGVVIVASVSDWVRGGKVGVGVVNDRAVAPSVISVARLLGAVSIIYRNNVALKISLVIILLRCCTVNAVHKADHSALVVQENKIFRFA